MQSVKGWRCSRGDCHRENTSGLLKIRRKISKQGRMKKVESGRLEN
jgi:hypothetical protein